MQLRITMNLCIDFWEHYQMYVPLCHVLIRSLHFYRFREDILRLLQSLNRSFSLTTLTSYHPHPLYADDVVMLLCGLDGITMLGLKMRKNG